MVPKIVLRHFLHPKGWRYFSLFLKIQFKNTWSNNTLNNALPALFYFSLQKHLRSIDIFKVPELQFSSVSPLRLTPAKFFWFLFTTVACSFNGVPNLHSTADGDSKVKTTALPPPLPHASISPPIDLTFLKLGLSHQLSNLQFKWRIECIRIKIEKSFHTSFKEKKINKRSYAGWALTACFVLVNSFSEHLMHTSVMIVFF